MWSTELLAAVCFLSSLSVTAYGQGQGQIVSGSTTFPLNEDTENCANRVQQGHSRKPGAAVSKCLQTPISTPAPDEPYFDIPGCSKIQVTPQEGETVILRCKIINIGSYRVTWFKTIRDSPIHRPACIKPSVISFGDDKAIKDDRISLVGDQNKTFHLEITDINSRDDGIYRCQISETHNQKSWNITLKVQVAPSIKGVRLVPGSNGIIEDDRRRAIKFMYNETDKVAIQCIPDGYPLPTLEWRKENEPFIRRGPNLTISNVNRNDSGVYICMVGVYLGPSVDNSRQQKETEKRIELVVQYKPEVIPKKTDIREPGGKYLQLECSVNSNPPAAYTWLKDNEPVPEYHSQVDKPKSTRIPLVCKEDKTRLIILSLDSDNDYGNYSCIASNILGSDTGIIEVSGKPRQPSIKSPPLSNKKHAYRLIWTSGSNGDPNEDATFLPIDTYVIQYQGWWYVKSGEKTTIRFSHQQPLSEIRTPEQSDCGTKRLCYVLRDLKQNITYDVYLFGINKYGEGEKAFYRFRTNIEDTVDPTTTPTPTQPLFGERESRNWYKEPPKNTSPLTRPSLWISTSVICYYLLKCLMLRSSV